MVRIAITMRPEARVVFADMEIPLMLDVGAMRAMGRPGSVLNSRGMGSRKPPRDREAANDCRARELLRSRERGVAFVLVLWVIAMLSILLGSFALVARTENLQSRHLFDTTQARYAAEAGLNLAIFELRKARPR